MDDRKVDVSVLCLSYNQERYIEDTGDKQTAGSIGEKKTMKVVLLAGGLGTRISEESTLRPKPMIEIGGMPILWHIMKEYSYYCELPSRVTLADFQTTKKLSNPHKY